MWRITFWYLQNPPCRQNTTFLYLTLYKYFVAFTLAQKSVYGFCFYRMCCARFPLVVAAYSQWLHWCPLILLWTPFICVSRLPLVEDAYPHSEHLYGLSFWWMPLICISRFPLVVAEYWHPLQLYFNVNLLMCEKAKIYSVQPPTNELF